MSKIIKVGIAVAAMSVSGLAVAGGCCGNSTIQQYNAYGPGQHMDQYGNNVSIVPKHGGGGGASNTFNRIERPNAYGPGTGMDQYGRPVTVERTYGRQNQNNNSNGRSTSSNWLWAN